VSAFDFRAFFELAQDLGSRSDEASHRSAVSRAYYALFAAAWTALPASEQTGIDRRQIHRALWNRYAISSEQACRRVGGAGARVRDLRHIADYRDDVSFPTRDVRSALDQVGIALRLIDRHGFLP
jgi:uncharacterized protein (UPF0332 family)